MVSFYLLIIKIDKASDLKLHLIYQNNIIKDYENWTHLLINIINHTKSSEKELVHVDYATSIQKYLEKLTKLEIESFDLQKKFIQQSDKLKDKQKEINSISTRLEIIKSDINLSYQNISEKERQTLLNNETIQLIDNIELMTEELDNLYYYKNKQKVDNETEVILNLLEEIKNLEQENKDLKQIKNLSYLDYFTVEEDIQQTKQSQYDPKHRKNNSNSTIGNIHSTYNLYTKEDKEKHLVEREIIIKKKEGDNNNKRNKNNMSNNIYDLSSLSCFSNINAGNENDSTINYLK